MKYVSLFLTLMVLCACNSNADPGNTSSKDMDVTHVTAKDIESLQYTEYVLSPEAKKAVADWQRYQELNMQVDYLKQADFSFFGGENELMNNFLTDLRTGIPESVSSTAIKERLIALETKLLKLHSNLKLKTLKKTEILGNIKEFLVARSNLVLQINKKFELESQVIEDPSTPTIAP